jgi:hypothetical protein
MKLLFENWRKHLKEGDVIDISHLLPQEPEIDYGPSEEEQESLQLVIKIEEMAADRLAQLHGGHGEIPIEKINALENIIDGLEALLKT